MKKQNRRRLAAASIGTLVLALHPASAQETSPVSATTAADNEVVTLEEFTIRESALAAAGDILPTSRPVLSVFGSGSIIETPRSVSVLTPELMKQFDIQDFSDLAKFGAGTQQANYYGVPGIPTLRGAKGSVYFNGMQRAFNRNEMPLSFGSLEGMDLVKGPAPAHFGAALVGGYVNLIPKSPYFDQKRGSLQIEVGQYDHIRSQFDVGGPTLLLGKPAAYRVSVTGQLADSYYDRVGNDFVSLYGSIKAEVARDLTLFTGAEYFNYKSNENAGWNRLTQNLVDRGEYVIGESMSISDSRWGGQANRRLHNPNPLNGFADTNVALVVPDSVVLDAFGSRAAARAAGLLDMSDPADRAIAYAGIDPADLANIAQTTTGFQYTPAYINGADTVAGTNDDGRIFTTKIDGSTVLADEADFADSQNFFWFADLESRRNPDRTIKYQTIVEYISTEKRSSYSYAIDTEQFVNEHKLTLTEDIDFFDTTLTYGASIRYTRAKQLQDFWDEPFSRRDISRGTISGNSIVFSGGVDPEGVNRWNDPFTDVEFSAVIGGNSIESDLLQNSVFLYTESDLTSRLKLYTSLLAAWAPYELRVPGEARVNAPLVAPDVEGEKDYYSGSVSPVLKLTENTSLYVMLQRGTAIDPLQGGPIVGEGSFAENELIEVGAKSSLLNNRLFVGAAAYQWRQGGFDARNNAALEYDGEGVELEVTYKPTDNFAIIASANHQTVELNSPLGFRVVPASEAEFALYGGELQTPFSQNLANFGKLAGANNPDRQVPGTPEVQLKLFGVYQLDNGFGISSGFVWSDEYYADYNHSVELPSSLVFNSAIFYRKPSWEVSLQVENVTDEDYFYGADPLFAASGVITKAPERNFKVAYTYKF
jgi:iron complex outermembrane receptor protein